MIGYSLPWKKNSELVMQTGIAGQAQLARLSLVSPLYAYGFSIRKRAIVRRFLYPFAVRFVWHPALLPQGATVLVWGSQKLDAHKAARVIRLEDGFMRSVGLGADLTRPLSWVLDQTGIYYDASQASDLELLLQHGNFSEQMLARAAQLRKKIVDNGISKYNLSVHGWERPAGAQNVILVPGQVEKDASIQRGTAEVATNLALLKKVRALHPEAYIVYKPHPDVATGLRARDQNQDQLRHWCDEIVDRVAIQELLGNVDAVHVMTSLTGFEALLRNIKVTCHGRPFYAGWGLTQDLAAPIARRGRQLTLDVLVAATLIMYPCYVSSRTGQAVTPEQALDELIALRNSSMKDDQLAISGRQKLLRIFLRWRGRNL